jgi:hypothetical protein
MAKILNIGGERVKSRFRRATKGAVLGTAATQGVYTELYEKLHFSPPP